MKIERLSFDEIERLFVMNFIESDKRDRALYQLTSKKKRRDFFSGLRGDDGRLRQKFVDNIIISVEQNEQQYIISRLRSNGGEESCYMMSYIRELDRQRIALDKGVVCCMACPMETVLVCRANLVFIQGEPVNNVPPRAILHFPDKPT